MLNILLMSGFILLCLLAYRYGLPRLKKFDENNVARIEHQAREKSDPHAHIRHALDIASEQVEEIQDVQVGAVTHYLFEAEVFTTREDAEEMRARRVGVVARRFYEELPAALMDRGGPRSNLSARERASQRWKRTVH